MPSKCPGEKKCPAPGTGQGEREVPSTDNSGRASGACLRRVGPRAAASARAAPCTWRPWLSARAAPGRALDARLLGNCVRLSAGFRESPLPSPRNNRFGGFTFWGRRRGETRWGIRGARAVSELPPQLLCTLKLNWAETDGRGPSKRPRRCWRTCLPGSHLYSSLEKSQIWEEPELERKKKMP